MSLKRKQYEIFKLREKDIEKQILAFLSTIKGGWPCKVELGGRPVKKGNGYALIPFKSPFFRKGFSDIMFCYKGTTFFFEVKIESEYKWIMKHYGELKKFPPEMWNNKKHRHYSEQVHFIEGVRRAGNQGFFVCNLEQVKEALKGL